MSFRIYDEHLAATRQLRDEGYEDGGHNGTAEHVVHHEGRNWSRDRFLVRNVSGFERFALFFTTLFKKIGLCFSIIDSSQADKINAQWNAVFSGRLVVVIYVLEGQNHQSPIINAVRNAAHQQGWTAQNRNDAPPAAVAALTAEETACKEQVEASSAEYQALMRTLIAQLSTWIGPVNQFVRPSITPLEQAFVISIPSARHLAAHSAPLRARLQEKLAAANINVQPQEVLSAQGASAEYRLSAADMRQLLAAIPDLSLDAAARAKLLAFANVNFAHPALSTSKADIETAISFTLAKTNPALRSVVANVVADRTRSNMSHVLPLVDIDAAGMTIRIPEGMDVLAGAVKSAFKIQSELEEMIVGSRQYGQKFFIQRDDIKGFLQKIGLDNLPVELGDSTYFDTLVRAGHVHDYAPQYRDLPLETLNASLSALVPNVRLNPETFEDEPFIPHTAMHAKGWLSIRLPKHNQAAHLFADQQPDNHYAEGLQHFLGLEEPSAIDFQWNGVLYDREYRIDPRDVPDFLKKIRLEKDADGEDFLEKLAVPAVISEYGPLSQERDVLQAIAQNIASLNPEMRQRLSRGQSLHIPRFVDFSRHGSLEILLPQELTNSHVEVAPGQRMPFGQYLSHMYGIKGQAVGQSYRLTVAPEFVRSFLEKDLGMRELPSAMRTSSDNSYYDALLALNSGFFSRNLPYLAIKGWNLRNPTQPLPGNIPQLTDDQIIQNANRLLANDPRRDQFCVVIRVTLTRAVNELAPATAAMLRNYLTLITTPVQGMVLADEQRRTALVSIGLTATACMPGRFTKVQQEYKYLVQPESRDQIKTLLLEKTERFKENILPGLFTNAGIFNQNDMMHVHAVAAAQAAWGEELGLDVEAAQRDDNIGCGRSYVTNAKKEQFKQLCQANLVSNLFDELSQTREDEGEGLMHADLYKQRLTRILQNQGYTLAEIEGQEEHDISGAPYGGIMDRFMPLDDQGLPTLTRAAVEALLIDVEVLQG